MDDQHGEANQYPDEDYVVHSFSAYALQDDLSAGNDKFFTWLPVSVSPEKTVKVLVQVDSAATCNTMPSHMYRQLAMRKDLQPSNARIKPYAGDHIRPLGKQMLACEGNDCFHSLEFEVIDSADIPGKPALLSGKDSKRLGLIIFDKDKVFASHTSNVKPPKNAQETYVNALSRNKSPTPHDLKPGFITEEDLKAAYSDNFKGLGKIGAPVHIEVDPNVKPFHAAVHRIPVAKHAKVKAKLDQMVAEGKLEKVESPTIWCNNMTVREKTLTDESTKLRICLDPSQTVNKAIIIPKYQIPTTAELLPRLSGKKYKTFTILDALDGFTQVELDEESSELTTMHTPWGRYKWRRLAYGLSNAPEEFQLRIHEALDGLRDVCCIADDILVFGQGDTREAANKNHDENLMALMQRVAERNLKLNPRKVQFKLQNITFMGSVISEDGLHPDPLKIKAIVDMPTPEDKNAVMRFCGMANYLNSFCPNLSTVIKPLYDLTRNEQPFIWSPTHDAAFREAKDLMVKAPCLSYFDVAKPVYIQADASQKGLGASLLQPNESGKLQPVAFTSSQMRPNEEAWAQIEKECLAIVSACDKWDQWIYGLTVVTVFTQIINHWKQSLKRR